MAGRKGARGHNEESAKIDCISVAEVVRALPKLANEYAFLLVKWVVLNNLFQGRMECVVDKSIAGYVLELYEQATEDQGEGEGENIVISQRILTIIWPTKEVVGGGKRRSR